MAAMDRERDRSSRHSHRRGRRHHDSPDSSPQPQNAFANDGSFMEMFKKKMEEEKRRKEMEDDSTPRVRDRSRSPVRDREREVRVDETPTDCDNQDSSTSQGTVKSNVEQAEKKSKLMPFVGRRRGGAPVLKCGTVAKKVKADEDDSGTKKDAWAQYMAEVKRYKDTSCQDEDKTRPLVK